MKKSCGFTLVELMVTMFIVGVLVTLGLPSMKSFIQNNRVIAASNELVSAIHVARSEAIKQNVGVTICESNDGTSCDTTGEWRDGWIVFVDADYNLTGTGQPCNAPNTDCLLRTHDGYDAGQMQITGLDANSAGISSITFTSRGRPLAANGAATSAVFSVCGLDAGTTSVSRAVVLSLAGRVRVSDNAAVITCP